jgi:hypothetical protein
MMIPDRRIGKPSSSGEEGGKPPHILLTAGTEVSFTTATLGPSLPPRPARVPVPALGGYSWGGYREISPSRTTQRPETKTWTVVPRTVHPSKHVFRLFEWNAEEEMTRSFLMSKIEMSASFPG